MNIRISPPKTYVYMTKRELVGDCILDEGYYSIADLDDYMDRFVDLEKGGACQLLTDAEMQAVLEEQGVVDAGVEADVPVVDTLPSVTLRESNELPYPEDQNLCSELQIENDHMKEQHEQTLPPQTERSEPPLPSTTLPAQPETAGSPSRAATNPKKTTKKKDKPEAKPQDKTTETIME